MSSQPQTLTESNAFSCFKVNVDMNLEMPAWLNSWNQQIADGDFKINSRHNEAMARLMPFLLCGEQSAIQVFGSEVERLRGGSWSKSINLLESIESDEYAHEQALRNLSSLLMKPDDIDGLKRKARHFYMKLGRTTGMAEHFARVAQLDACVCIIMNEIAKSDLGKNNLAAQLLDRIKKDEARHVGVSRKHYHYLGGDEEMLKRNKSEISNKLVSLLSTEAESFESLGVDSDILFRKLVGVKQPLTIRRL